MRTKFKYPLNYCAMVTAMASFSIGALVLVLFKSTGDSGLIAIGDCYTWFAALVNTLLLFLLIPHTARCLNEYIAHLTAICIVLPNLPISLFYMRTAL